ncbi:MAG: hypothetical protein CMI31_15080, partial [Opitutae bacterium]|nr:hypothetical protein [Opitutae bacterium]
SRIKSILEVLRYSWARPQKSSLVIPCSELLSIVVEPAFRGKGVAQGLYERLKDFFCSSDVPGFKIAVGSDLLSAHRFYCRIGAKPLLDFQVHDGETSILFLQSLRSNEDIK